MGANSRDNYRRKHGRKTNGPPFVQLHYYLLDSTAWHGLSPVARCAYIELQRVYNGVNNGSLAMSVRKLAAVMPCALNTATRALNELEIAGFVDVMKVGTFRLKERHASEYRLTCHRCDITGELPSKRFDPSRKWRPESEQPRSQKLRQMVAKIATDVPLETASVSKNATVRPISAPSTVSNIDTHIESYHRQGGSEAENKPQRSRSSKPILALLDRNSATAKQVWSAPILIEITGEDLIAVRRCFEPQRPSIIPDVPGIPEFLRRVRA
jgi:hypothetical protein